MEQVDLHNQLAGKIVASIVKPPLDHGGSETDVLVLLESVVAGVVLAITRLGGDAMPAALEWVNYRRMGLRSR